MPTIDSYRFLDWVAREADRARDIPWAPMRKPLSGCTIAKLLARKPWLASRQ